MNFSKRELLDHGKRLVASKEKSLIDELEAIRDSASSDAKSSMGDKYETSREMMRQEERKVASQLEAVAEQMVALDRLDPEGTSDKVEIGALVETRNACFFISTSLGRVELGNQPIFFISPVAPLTKLLLGSKEGDRIAFNGVTHVIRSIR